VEPVYQDPRVNRSRRFSVRGAAILVVILAALAVVHRANGLKTQGAHVSETTIDSVYVGSMRLKLVVPAGAGPGRPLLVFLHGRGGDQNSELSDQMFAALRALGPRAPDIAFPNGGDHSFWHNRESGRWGSYVLREVIPEAVQLLHADGRRVAIGGISMGGFGAFDLARQQPGRFCAVGGHSAAIWPSGRDTPPGAFDNAADFRRHNVLALARANPHLFGGARMWLDGGRDDPFHAADEALAAALHIHMYVWPGGHDFTYWNSHWRAYLGFYAAALANCRT
jgi:S-formylglutathione hydrolase FrmB